MFGRGKIRGDGKQLARYLLTGKDGEIAELVEAEGLEAFGPDPETAFDTLDKIADAQTKCEKPFYHLSIRLYPNEDLTLERWIECADEAEKRLGFQGQPRLIAFHTDPESGDRHLHIAWYRVDLETMHAIDPGLDRNKLKHMCRDLERRFALREVSNVRQPSDRARSAVGGELEESRRLGTDIKEIRNAILDCYEQSDSGKAFKAALEERGLCLAKGDRRDCFVVIDQLGGHHALNKRLTGHTLAEINERFGDLDRSQLPTVDAAKDLQMEAYARDHPGQNQSTARGRYAALRPNEDEARKQLGKTAGEIRLAWSLTKTGEQFAERLEDRGLLLVYVAKEDADARVRTKEFAKAVGRRSRVLHEGFAVVDGRGYVTRIDQRVTGEQWEVIQKRLGGVNRDELLNVSQAREVMREVNRGEWREKKEHERAEKRMQMPLGNTASEIRLAWNLSQDPDLERDVRLLQEHLKVRRISLAVAGTDDVRANERAAAFAEALGRHRRILREGEIVAINERGDVYRLDEHTTGRFMIDVEDRLAALDKSTLPSIADARESMRSEARARATLSVPAAAIRTAWGLSGSEDPKRDISQLEDGLAADGMTLARVTAVEAADSQKQADLYELHKRERKQAEAATARGAYAALNPSAPEEVRYTPRLTKDEIVVVDGWGNVYRLDERTTGQARLEIDSRLSRIEASELLNVTDAQLSMRAAAIESWKHDRSVEREQARAPNWVERRIAQHAEAVTNSSNGFQINWDVEMQEFEAVNQSQRREALVLKRLSQDPWHAVHAPLPEDADHTTLTAVATCADECVKVARVHGRVAAIVEPENADRCQSLHALATQRRDEARERLRELPPEKIVQLSPMLIPAEIYEAADAKLQEENSRRREGQEISAEGLWNNPWTSVLHQVPDNPSDELLRGIYAMAQESRDEASRLQDRADTLEERALWGDLGARGEDVMADVARELEQREVHAAWRAPEFSRKTIKTDPWTSVFLPIPANADAGLLAEARSWTNELVSYLEYDTAHDLPSYGPGARMTRWEVQAHALARGAELSPRFDRVSGQTPGVETSIADRSVRRETSREQSEAQAQSPNHAQFAGAAMQHNTAKQQTLAPETGAGQKTPAQEFTAGLERAGITIARVRKADLPALKAKREEKQLAQAGAHPDGLTTRDIPRMPELVPGDLAAVTRRGEVYRFDPGKIDTRLLSEELPAVAELLPSRLEDAKRARSQEKGTPTPAEEFAKRLEDSGISVARVATSDLPMIDAKRQERQLAEAGAHPGGLTTREIPRIPELAVGDLVGITRKGEIYTLNTDKLGGAEHLLPEKLPSVEVVLAVRDVERTVAMLRSEDAQRDRREANAYWDEVRVNAMHDHHLAREAAELAEGTEELLMRGRREAGAVFQTFARMVENTFDFLVPEPKLTPLQAELVRAHQERMEEQAVEAAAQAKEDDLNYIIGEQARTAGNEQDALSYELAARNRPEMPRDRATRERERERERDRNRD